MFNKKTLLGSLIIVTTLLLVVIAFTAVFYPSAFQREYTALSTIHGEFYVGKASSMPFSSTVKLTDVFVLQNFTDEETETANPQLIPMVNSLWQPKSISFYKENIVFTGKVSRSSEIGRSIENYTPGAMPEGQGMPGAQDGFQTAPQDIPQDTLQDAFGQ